MAARNTATATPVTKPADETTPAAPAAPAAPAPSTENATAGAATASTHFGADDLAKIKTAPAWRPSNGETITGEIVVIAKRSTAEYGDYPCVILKDVEGKDGFIAVHAFHGVLINELKEMKAKRGMAVTVLYTGKRAANKLNADGSEKNYHGYSVVPVAGGEVEAYAF